MTGSSHTRHHSNVSHVLFYISTKRTKPMVTYLSALKFSNQPLKRGSKFTPLKMKFFQLVEKQAARLYKNPVNRHTYGINVKILYRCIHKIDNV